LCPRALRRRPDRGPLRPAIPRADGDRADGQRPPDRAPRAPPLPRRGADRRRGPRPMIDLPLELAPWRALLGLFPPALAASLGAWIPEIDRIIGPLRAARPRAQGEPDGFSGIARRGGVERLLLSEWLLAEEAPDEFVRRAAMSELSYLEI